MLQVFGRPYHPQSEGKIGRYNYTLKRMWLFTIVHNNTRSWLFILDQTKCSHNIKHNRAINNTPINAFYGFPGFKNDINKILGKFNNKIYSAFRKKKKAALEVIEFIVLLQLHPILKRISPILDKEKHFNKWKLVAKPKQQKKIK